MIYREFSPMRFAAIALSLALISCASEQPAAPAKPEISVTSARLAKQAAAATDAPVVIAVPCVVMTLPAPQVPRRSDSRYVRWQEGKLPDPKNLYDTPGTVAQLRKLTTVFDAICGGP